MPIPSDVQSTLPKEIEGPAIRLEPLAKPGINLGPGTVRDRLPDGHGQVRQSDGACRCLPEQSKGVLVVGNPKGAKRRDVKRIADVRVARSSRSRAVA